MLRFLRNKRPAHQRRGDMWMNAIGIIVLAIVVALVVAMVSIWNT